MYLLATILPLFLIFLSETLLNVPHHAMNMLVSVAAFDQALNANKISKCNAVFWMFDIQDFCLLAQGRAVQTAKSLDEGIGAVIELRSPDVVFDSNNNRLVHLSGSFKTDWVCF